jgi:hypothetical protein
MDLLYAERIALSEQLVRHEEEGWDMSSYASYCQDQGIDCAGKVTRGSNLLAMSGVSLA